MTMPTTTRTVNTNADKSVDWKVLERIEFKTLGEFWQWSTFGAAKARQTGLMLLMAKPAFTRYLIGIAGQDNHYNRFKARRIAKRIDSIANHLAGIKKDFERIPAEILKEFEAEIARAQGKTTSSGIPHIDLTK